MTVMVMMSILTSAISASCSFYSYTPPLLLPSLFHHTLFVILECGEMIAVEGVAHHVRDLCPHR